MTTAYAGVILGLLAASHLILALLTYRKTRGTRVVRCPITRGFAFVALDAVRGAVLLTRPEEVKVRRCSVWPEHRDCFQWCRDQIEDGRRRQGP